MLFHNRCGLDYFKTISVQLSFKVKRCSLFGDIHNILSLDHFFVQFKFGIVGTEKQHTTFCQ